jgi:hypothetical protein
MHVNKHPLPFTVNSQVGCQDAHITHTRMPGLRRTVHNPRCIPLLAGNDQHARTKHAAALHASRPYTPHLKPQGWASRFPGPGAAGMHHRAQRCGMLGPSVAVHWQTGLEKAPMEGAPHRAVPLKPPKAPSASSPAECRPTSGALTYASRPCAMAQHALAV